MVEIMKPDFGLEDLMNRWDTKIDEQIVDDMRFLHLSSDHPKWPYESKLDVVLSTEGHVLGTRQTYNEVPSFIGLVDELIIGYNITSNPAFFGIDILGISINTVLEISSRYQENYYHDDEFDVELLSASFHGTGVVFGKNEKSSVYIPGIVRINGLEIKTAQKESQGMLKASFEDETNLTTITYPEKIMPEEVEEIREIFVHDTAWIKLHRLKPLLQYSRRSYGPEG